MDTSSSTDRFECNSFNRRRKAATNWFAYDSCGPREATINNNTSKLSIMMCTQMEILYVAKEWGKYRFERYSTRSHTHCTHTRQQNTRACEIDIINIYLFSTLYFPYGDSISIQQRPPLRVPAAVWFPDWNCQRVRGIAASIHTDTRIDQTTIFCHW